MATKKETKKSKPNVDMLFKKVDDLGKRLEVLEVDIRDIAVEVVEIEEEFEASLSLIDRIRDRLGL
jgi:uncharacterized coiled-coil DUF342 family protein